MQEKNQKTIKNVVVLGLGGTIAGLAAQSDDNVNYQAGQVSVADLLAGLGSSMAQSLNQAGIEVITEQVAQLDSKDMSFQVWQQLMQRVHFYLSQPEVVGLVITHGTDTLEETAYFLHRTVHATKPIVLTCAMRPASALHADGPQNLRDAILLAQQSQLQAVVVACDGAVHSAQDVQKDHPYRTAAFSSRDNGVLAWIEESEIRQVRAWPVADNRPEKAIQKLLDTSIELNWPRVEIVMNYAGCDGALVQALLHPQYQLQGCVVAGTGNGTLSQGLIAQLKNARQQGVKVWACSRCALGRVVGNVSEGVDEVIGLSAVKARVELILQLLNR